MFCCVASDQIMQEGVTRPLTGCHEKTVMIEETPGYRCSIPDEHGRLMAGLGSMGPAQRITGPKTPKFTKIVVEAAEDMGSRIKRPADLVILQQVSGEGWAANAREAALHITHEGEFTKNAFQERLLSTTPD
jgi:hypothetical protein